MNKLLPLILINLILLGCTNTGEGYMQQNELLIQIEKGNAPVIVDVRSNFEYQKSHVPGALHIPFWSTFSTNKLENVAKTDLIILYCEHGPRAGVAKLAFYLSGFKNLKYLSGHMTGWKKLGLPVEPK